MLVKLKYSVTFPQTGRTLSADLVFERGFTAITGPNESGKSMIFEMARYLLFGSQALRGKAEHYKNLTASGTFIIRENVVEIERTPRGATMKRNGVVVATGTKPVNGKVVEELGFGMKVFDTANSINQGEVEALGKMLPQQRKAMIDNVLGLAVLDNIAKWGAEEAKAHSRQADSLRERLTPPGIAPEQPKGYLPSASIEARLADARNDAQDLATIEGWLANPMAKPEQPTTKVDLPAENLRSLADKRRAAREDVERLKARVNALPETAPFTNDLLDQVEAAWAAFHAYDVEARWARQNPRPELNGMQLDDIEVAWANIGLWATYDARVTEADRLRAALDSIDKVDCPGCGTSFALHAEHAARLQQELDAIDLTKPIPARLDRPTVSESRVAELRAQLATFDADRMSAFEAMTPVAKPDLNEHEIMGYRHRIDQAVERVGLVSELSVVEQSFTSMADFEAMLAERERYETALADWKLAFFNYEAWVQDREVKLFRKNQLAGSAEIVDRIGQEFRDALDWEVRIDHYEKLVEDFQRANEVIAELDSKASEHRKVREVMAVLRGLIKQFVLPSLNSVASQLLRQMTGGQRNIIVVDDEFDVVVDGQELDTLSGSGKAVANLSLRIALGQVLTNRVMSIMLADEIDASMDDFRAEKTSDVLRMLEERVSQVLLVSHKSVEAPHHVRLGELYDDDDSGCA